jgi:hypothetical protein
MIADLRFAVRMLIEESARPEVSSQRSDLAWLSVNG